MTTPTPQTHEDPKAYWQGFPESPYATSFKWIDETGFEHLTTVRGWSFTSMMGSVQKATAMITEQGGKPAGGKPGPAPSAEAPGVSSSKIQMKTEDGLPVVDANGQPVMVDLPEGHHLFTVKEVYHDTNQSGDKHMLKVVLEERYEYGNGKYGVSCFHPESHFAGWKQWEKGKRYAPPVNAAKVIIRDPKPGGKWADVIEFRPA